MRLILTRHGRTIENEQGISQGHMPGRLSKTGVEQAQKLAQRLKNEKFVAIYSSDLARAADTARIIAKHHPGIPLYYTKDLRERDHGRLTGMKKSDIKDYHDDGESRKEMYARVKRVIDEAYDKYPDSAVLFMGHGAINVMLTTLIRNKQPEQADHKDAQSNTAVSIFEIKEDKNHKIIFLNCTKHLS